MADRAAAGYTIGDQNLALAGKSRGKKKRRIEREPSVGIAEVNDLAFVSSRYR
jgi:hypothetical protein